MLVLKSVQERHRAYIMALGIGKPTLREFSTEQNVALLEVLKGISCSEFEAYLTEYEEKFWEFYKYLRF